METKTAEQILREVLIEEGIEHGEDYIDSYGAIDAVQVAMIRFAKQFIDLAAEKAKLVRTHNDGKKESFYCVGNYHAKTTVDKQSILDIKQLIK